MAKGAKCSLCYGRKFNHFAMLLSRLGVGNYLVDTLTDVSPSPITIRMTFSLIIPM